MITKNILTFCLSISQNKLYVYKSCESKLISNRNQMVGSKQQNTGKLLKEFSPIWNFQTPTNILLLKTLCKPNSQLKFSYEPFSIKIKTTKKLRFISNLN